MNKRKFLLWIAVICLVAMLLPNTVLAATDGWNMNSDGTWSYYEYGEWVRNEIRWIDGEYYGFDATGRMYENKWFQDEDSGIYYYFGKDGIMYREGVYKIGDAYYGFDYSGWMYSDQEFEFYDSEQGKWSYYRAKASGALYVDCWYDFGDGQYYYYGADGAKATNGVYKIGDVYYGFDHNGWMYKDQQFDIYDSEQGKWIYYRAKADGSLYVNSWYQDEEGQYYYYGAGGKAPREQVLKIGNAYYGFGYSGYMYTDVRFGFYNADLEKWTYYHAKEDGTLYRNEWYDDYMYYGDDCVAAEDFVKIDGIWYFFQDGYKVSQQIVKAKNGKYYYMYNEGKSYVEVANRAGWFKIGNDYYYHKGEGELLQNEVANIGGKYYGFSWEGRMYKNQSFSAYDSTTENWCYYRAKENGELYVNQWYQSGSTYYYYGAEGKAANDFVKVNGQWYFFDYEGRMVTNSVVQSVDGYYYIISADGASYTKVTSDGWVQVDGEYYYFANGTMYSGGAYQIGGKYYVFNYEGRMLKNRTYSTFDEKLSRDVSYRAKENGELYVNQWYQSDSTYYYYGAEGKSAYDFEKVNGKWYFFDSYGRMVTNALVYSEFYDCCYVISADGASSTKITKDGWVRIDQIYYYVLNGRKCQNSVVQIGGKYYGFDYDGRMYEDESFSSYDSETGDWGNYRAKADGSLYVNEWYESEEGEWYYYGEKAAAPYGRTEVGGAWYYFSYGRMYSSDVADIGGKYYAFGKDGKQITAQGKQNIGGAYVYVQADGSLVEGWQQSNGKWCYFEPTMLANALTEIDGKLYAIDNAGVCVAVTGNGIYNIGTEGKVYLVNGKITTGWQKVNGSWYYFGDRMYADGVYEIDEELYVFDVNGKMFTGGWLLLGEYYWGENYKWYVYAEPSGKAAIGLKTIGSKQYIFAEDGTLYTNAAVTLDGVGYTTDKNGVATKVTTDGWKLVDGKYFYVQGGQVVTEQTMTIGGKLYAFDYSGQMATNDIWWSEELEGDILLGANGAAVTGWYKMGADWYYAGNDYKMLHGKQTIGGKQYIFDYRMLTGTFWWDGKIVTTDTSGAIISEKDPADGWSYVDGQVYYYKNGLAYDGWVGDYLIVDGRMQINEVTEWNGDHYAFDAYGRYVKSGWYQFSWGYGTSDYVYAKAGGKLCCNEWLKLNGVHYYFSGVYMASHGVYEIKGEFYEFADNGKYLGKVASLTGEGWKKQDGQWYYLHGGETVTGVQCIDGERYVFDYDGRMLSNSFYEMEEQWYYVDSTGKIPAYTGWKKINGVWNYFDNNNLPVMGWFQADGKVYYCGEYVKDDAWYVGMFTGYQYIYDYGYNYYGYGAGKLHYFGTDGVHQGEIVKNGWFKADGEWYYFRDGKPVNGYQTIDGKNYFFTGGTMSTNTITYRGYFDASGVQRTTKGWFKTAAGWIYVKDDGTLCNGVQKIDGKEYYFYNYIQIR